MTCVFCAHNHDLRGWLGVMYQESLDQSVQVSQTKGLPEFSNWKKTNKQKNEKTNFDGLTLHKWFNLRTIPPESNTLFWKENGQECYKSVRCVHFPRVCSTSWWWKLTHKGIGTNNGSIYSTAKTTNASKCLMNCLQPIDLHGNSDDSVLLGNLNRCCQITTLPVYNNPKYQETISLPKSRKQKLEERKNNKKKIKTN